MAVQGTSAVFRRLKYTDINNYNMFVIAATVILTLAFLLLTFNKILNTDQRYINLLNIYIHANLWQVN